MNPTTIIIAALALLTGGAAGYTLNNQASEVTPLIEPLSNTVATDDFLSLRPALVNFPTETLSEAEITDLVFIREEEKLARDVYQTLYEKWEMPIFYNIAQSEQTHTEAVRDLLEKYDLNDPVTDDSTGVFTNPELQALYNSLVETGLKSKVEALSVGATIEDLDLKDLRTTSEMTDNEDVKLVYENLLRGSRNHLRSFSKQLKSMGVTYSPQHITQAEYDAVISSMIEQGSGKSKGGRGWGGR